MEREQNPVEEGEEGEEETLCFDVPYIHNGFILNHIVANGNASTTEMVLDLPLCHCDDRLTMSACLSQLKKKRETLGKAKSKSPENADAYQRFIDAEFIFPSPKKNKRFQSNILIRSSFHRSSLSFTTAVA